MKRHWILVCGSALLFAVACADGGGTTEEAAAPAAAGEAAATEAPAASTPAEETTPAAEPASAEAPAEGEAPEAAPRLVAPARGTVEIQLTQPRSRRDGEFVVTTFRVKNMANAPLAGLRIDEFWYDKSGNPVGGAPTFRQRTPLQPGEVIDVELRTPTNPAMNQPQWQFRHANGEIRTTRVDKL